MPGAGGGVEGLFSLLSDLDGIFDLLVRVDSSPVPTVGTFLTCVVDICSHGDCCGFGWHNEIFGYLVRFSWFHLQSMDGLAIFQWVPREFRSCVRFLLHRSFEGIFQFLDSSVVVGAITRTLQVISLILHRALPVFFAPRVAVITCKDGLALVL